MSAASRKAWFDVRRQVNTWVTLPEFKQIERMASDHGLTVSAFAREQVLAAVQPQPEIGARRGGGQS